MDVTVTMPLEDLNDYIGAIRKINKIYQLALENKNRTFPESDRHLEVKYKTVLHEIILMIEGKNE